MTSPCRFVIFGAAGHLASTKLLPSLFTLEQQGRLGADVSLVAFARRDWDTGMWRDHVVDMLSARLGDELDRSAAVRFAERFEYVRGDHNDPAAYTRLRESIHERPHKCDNIVFYLAIRPADFAGVVRRLDAAGLAGQDAGHRVVVEKPFGVDLASARALNAELHRYFDESQIFRIDHYLGKETVQNLLVFRFANSIIEPLWNRNHIDHVQVTVAEIDGISTRAAYFDRIGTLRDMIQNHLLQLLTLVAMEPPARLEADRLRDEKVKVLRSIRELTPAAVTDYTLRGQYAGYRGEPDVPESSNTETYAALRLHIDNWRWRGVPFYLRSGKRLGAQRSLVAIRFREPPQQLFRNTSCTDVEPNWLTLGVQPEENIRLELLARKPGLGMTTRLLRIDTDYREVHEQLTDAYATLLLDVIENDRSLFIRFDEVEMAWQVIEPILQAWTFSREAPAPYAAGSWGPPPGPRFFAEPHHGWRDSL